MNGWKLHGRRKRLAAVVRAAIENGIAHAKDDVNRSLGINGNLRLLRMLGSIAAGNLDRFACQYGRREQKRRSRQRADPQQGTWNSMHSMVPTANSGFASAALENRQ
jgi:hypothetical protein